MKKNVFSFRDHSTGKCAPFSGGGRLRHCHCTILYMLRCTSIMMHPATIFKMSAAPYRLVDTPTFLHLTDAPAPIF